MGRLGELAAELAEGEVLSLFLDQGERCDVPEGGGSADAEHHFVPIGCFEQSREAFADRADEITHRCLPVGRPEQVAARGVERADLLRANLGGPRAEPPVSGQQVVGDGHAFRCHRLSDSGR